MAQIDLNHKKNATKLGRQKSTLEAIQARRLFAASVILFALALIMLLLAYRMQRSARLPAATPQTAITLNQPISMGAVEMKIEKVTLTGGEAPFIAPAGKKYALVSLDVKNKSDKPIQLLPSSDTYMKSSDGEIAYISPYGLADPFRAGEVLPGERLKGELSYLISSDKEYKFYIDAIWSGGVIPFKTVD